MIFKLHVKILILTLIFSCQNNNSNEKNINDLRNSKKMDSTHFEKKNYYKEKIFNNYNQIPQFLFAINDGKDHSKYKEFKTLQNSFKKYEQLDLTAEEVQRLGIIKAKAFLKISKFDNAIRILDSLPFYKEYELYKELLRAISYDYGKPKNPYEQVYEKILSELKSSDSLECNRYIIVATLANLKDIEICKDQEEIYLQVQKIGKIEIIRQYILGEVEL